MSDNVGRAGFARDLPRSARRQPGAVAASELWRRCRAVGWLLVVTTNILLWVNYDTFTTWYAKVERDVRAGLTTRFGSGSGSLVGVGVGVKAFPLDRKG